MKTLFTIIGFIILPILLTFGTTNTPYESAFNPQPTNNFYDGMLVTICFSISTTRIFLEYITFTLEIMDSTSKAFVYFEILLPFFMGVLYCVCSSFGSGTVWIIFSIVNYLLMKPQIQKQFHKPDSNLMWCYSTVLVLWAVAFFVFPVFQSWAGPPESFVRWHPYNQNAELVWRGIFACYALMMIWTATHNPGKNLAFSLYLGISGGLHSTVMLIMNLVTKENGNHEHLYGDILLWYVIAFFSTTVCWLRWPSKKKIADLVPKIDIINDN